MSECGEAELCPLTRGDTAPFIFEFIGLDDEPLDLTGMALHFTMKLDPAQKIPDLHHVMHFSDLSVQAVDLAAPIYSDAHSKIAFIDPADRKRKFKYDFKTGMGTMKVLPRETRKLQGGQCYFFAFQLIGGPDDIYTVGSGKVKIAPDIAGIHPPVIQP